MSDADVCTYISNRCTVTRVAALSTAKCSFSAAGYRIFAPASLGVCITS